jgi:hypothetical protein
MAKPAADTFLVAARSPASLAAPAPAPITTTPSRASVLFAAIAASEGGENFGMSPAQGAAIPRAVPTPPPTAATARRPLSTPLAVASPSKLAKGKGKVKAKALGTPKKTKAAKKTAKVDMEIDEELHCSCRLPWGNRFMVVCDKCDIWYHGDCVGMTEDVSTILDSVLRI